MKLLSLTFCCCLGWSLAARAQNELANGIAVIVNDAVITIKDVQGFVAQGADLQRRVYAGQPKVLQEKLLELQRDGIEQLVERQLILDEFKTAGYPETLLDDAVDRTIKDDIRESFEKSRLTLAKTLASQGMTYERYRQQIKERIIISAMASKNVAENVVVSPHKLETFYAENLDKYKVEDQVKLRMIVLNKPKGGDATATRKLAEEVLAKIQAGADFAQMASVYSEGSQRSQGGDWDWVERSVLRKELAEVAFSLKKGERSNLIETPDSFYLMLVEDTRPAHVKPLNEVRDEIEKTLVAQERTRLRKKWVEKLKTKAFVRYY